MRNYTHLYKEDYFEDRDLNDPLRTAMFCLDGRFVRRHAADNGIICDVGCSTGEFLNAIGWKGERYGMEVSETARERAKQGGIKFNKSILDQKSFFDCVMFRGVIQHLPYPFWYMECAYEALKSGGAIIFLATPNTRSIYYRLFGTLPALDPPRNFYIPSDRDLANALSNIGFRVKEVEYPYLETPYARPVTDHLKFVANLLGRRRRDFAFWRNMMNVAGIKP